jgi:Skp family chaperone for outer membrane proteins
MAILLGEGMSTGRQLLEELRRDEELRRALAEELIPEALRNRQLRRAMLLAISKEMATKDDIEGLKAATKEEIEGLKKDVENLKVAMEGLKKDVESLREATKEDIEGLKKDMEALRKATKEDMEKIAAELKSYVDARIGEVNRRIDDLYGVMKASLVAIVVTLASTILVPLLLRVLF